MHILVIDDDPVRLRWFQDTLERAGHEVRLADHSEAALDQFKEARFDLAFFDHDLGLPTASRLDRYPAAAEVNGSRLLGVVLQFPKKYKTPRAIWIHSANPVGAENIASKCRSAEIRYCTGSYINLTKNPEGFLNTVATFTPKEEVPEQEPERWALLDMDSSLADFEAGMHEKLSAMRAPGEPDLPPEMLYPNDEPAWLEARKDAIKREQGFWLNLAPISFGIELYHQLGEWGYRRMVLTKGPRNNAMAWTEKVLWCQEHIPDAGVTITHDKGLTYGKILYDDFPPYILRWLEWRPRGRVLMLDAPHNQGFKHPNVLRCYRTPLAQQLEAIQKFIGEH